MCSHMKFQKLISFFSRTKTTGSPSIQLVIDSAAKEIRALKAKGNEFLNLGKLPEAIANYRAVVELTPRDAGAYIALGYAQLEAADLDAAKTNFASALAIDAESVDAHFFMGQLLVRQRLPKQALQSYKAALALKPDFDFAWCELAQVHVGVADLDAALNAFSKASSLNPSLADAAIGKVKTLLGLERWQEALVAVLACPFVGEHNIFRVYEALALQRLKRNEEALIVVNKALQQQPSSVEALQVKGTVLSAMGRYNDALPVYLQAIELDPTFASAMSDAGAIYARTGRFNDAVKMYALAIQAHPNNADAANNWASTLLGMGKCAEAVEVANIGLLVHPADADLHWTKAVSSLLVGDFSVGWIEHEWRWLAKGLGPRPLKAQYSQPMWAGEPLDGKTIWLIQEQGLGDSLQMLRYVPLLAARGAKILLSVQLPIRPLCTRLSEECIVLSSGQVVPPFDYFCPMFSLPLAFRTDESTIPADVPYLFEQEGLRQAWDNKLGPRNRPRIGLVWSGNSDHRNDENRSLPLATLLEAFSQRYQLVSLQKEVRNSDWQVFIQSAVVDTREELATFSDTAALIACMDLVISVDTSVAHLTGALGTQLWLMLPYCPDWRWMMHRDDSPWYPTALLFRQDEQRKWANVISNIRTTLAIKFPQA